MALFFLFRDEKFLPIPPRFDTFFCFQAFVVWHTSQYWIDSFFFWCRRPSLLLLLTRILFSGAFRCGAGWKLSPQNFISEIDLTSDASADDTKQLGRTVGGIFMKFYSFYAFDS